MECYVIDVVDILMFLVVKVYVVFGYCSFRFVENRWFIYVVLDEGVFFCIFESVVFKECFLLFDCFWVEIVDLVWWVRLVLFFVYVVIFVMDSEIFGF